MKTKFYLSVYFVCLFAFLCNAQSFTSVLNGSWMNPTTWSPFGIPIPGNIITVNTNVVLDTSFYIPSGSITVNSGASLKSDIHNRSLSINGGTFLNNGTTELQYIVAQTGLATNNGTLKAKSISSNVNFTNTGSILNLDSMYTTGTFTNNANATVQVGTFYNAGIWNNHGSIINADSITNAGTFTNYVNSSLQVDSLTNTGIFTNNGKIIFLAFTNYTNFTNHNYIGFHDFTNFGTFTNNDSLIGTHSFLNGGIFNNHASGLFNLGYNFLNADYLNHDAVFENEGLVNVANNWYNSDTIKGINGIFKVQQLTGNSGWMKGSFDFCDNTPPATTPKIDSNSGTISPNITYCTNTLAKLNSLPEEFSIFPNPANNLIYFSNSPKEFSTEILNLTGGSIYFNNNISQIDVSDFPQGMYILIIRDNYNNILFRKRFIKE